MGTLDVGHTLYMQAVLQGVMQQAARDSALESGSATAQQAALDTHVQEQVKNLNLSADVDLTRRYYTPFQKAAAAAADPLTDTHGNGRCDSGAPYPTDTTK